MYMQVSLRIVTFLITAASLLQGIALQAQVNIVPSDSAFVGAELQKEKYTKLSGYIEMNYHQHYLWRGALWGNNDVSQPELHLDYGNFSFAVSPNLNIYPKNLPAEAYKKKVVYDEQDFELGYQNAIGKLEYQFLLWGYFYFNQIETPNTGELCVKLQYPVWKNTKIYTENVVDIGSYKGAFYNATGLLYEKKWNQLAIEYKLFTGFGNATFNNSYYATDKAALNFTGTSLNIEYTFKNNFYVAAKGEYNQYSDKEIRLATGLNNTSNISAYFGLNF
jgi:hypothetical protein